MFNTFLTTALEVVILLDLLGVIIYFIISGIVRAKKNPGGGSVAPPGVAPVPFRPIWLHRVSHRFLLCFKFSISNRLLFGSWLAGP